MSISETLPPAAAAALGAVPSLSTPPPATSRAYAWVAAFLGLVAVGLLAVLFADHFKSLYHGWSTDDNYSHGFLVPVVSAWLAWEVIRRHGLPADGATVPGLFWVVTGCLLLLWDDIVGWAPIEFMALATLLFGFGILTGGRAWAKRFIFPILFLFFMFPLSPILLNHIATWLQDKVATTGTVLLQLFVPAWQEGNKIHLPGQQLEIGEQCSGLRQAVTFAALTLLVAHLSRRRWPFRLGIVLAGLPIAIAANLLRVMLMAFLLMHFGSESISEKRIVLFGISYHTGWGLLTHATGLGLLLGVAWWLGRVFPNKPAENGASGGSDPPSDSAPAAARQPSLFTKALVRRLGLAIVVLGVAAVLHVALQGHLASARDTLSHTISLKQPLQGEGDKGFPVSLGAWSGKDVSPDPATLPYFNAADDKLNRVYVRTDENGREVGPVCTLWMVHFRDAQDRNHHPLICYSVSGCTEQAGVRQTVPMAGPGSPAQRFCFTRASDAGYLSYVYYWHYTLEPPDVPGLSLPQRLHANWVKRPSLTVQVSTAGRTAEELDQASQFVRLVDERLRSHLPPGARRGSETYPITMRR
jgi:exosortase